MSRSCAACEAATQKYRIQAWLTQEDARHYIICRAEAGLDPRLVDTSLASFYR